MPAKKKSAVSVNDKPVAKPVTQKKKTASSSVAKSSTAAKSAVKPPPVKEVEETVGDEDSWSEDVTADGSDIDEFVEEADELRSDEEIDESLLTDAEREELEAIRWLHSYCDFTRKGRLRGVL